MKYLRLNPVTRQLTIFVLLVVILWQNRPTPGADGLVEARFEYYYGGKMGIPTPRAGRNIIIYSMSWDDTQKKSILNFEIQNAQLVRITEMVRPHWATNAVKYAPWLSSILPKRLVFSGWGDEIVVRIKPMDWEVLEAAKRKGYELDVELSRLP